MHPHRAGNKTQSPGWLVPIRRIRLRRTRAATTWLPALVIGLIVLVLTGCDGSRSAPTRTPFPTWTPTPSAGGAAQAAAPQPAQPAQSANADAGSLAVVAGAEQQQAGAPTPTPVPPTATPIPSDTPTPSPTPIPSDTPTPSPTPTVTPTPVYLFELEAAEKFATDALAPNVVRIFLYVHSPDEFGLPGYTLSVRHNQKPLTVDAVTSGGLPERTRSEPSAQTRFTNMSIVFVEPQAGEWEIQLIDENGTIVGPPATFQLTADEETRELYLRYKLK